MKKRKLLHISNEAADLIRRYEMVEKEDDSLYLNPDSKRDKLLASANQLVTSISNVNKKNPSFDEVTKIVSYLLEQAREPEGTTVHKETKDQVFKSLVEQLNPLLISELVGKYLCLKTGAYDFAVFKVTEVEAKVGIYKWLDICVSGTGFRYNSNHQNSDRSVYTHFTKISVQCISLLIDGKDRYDGKDRWLYVISEEEMVEEFTKLMEELAKLLSKVIGIDLKGNR